MAYKNWDDVREDRIYSYLNTQEAEKLNQACQQIGISQKATAIRELLMRISEQIINNSNDTSLPSKAPTAELPHLNGNQPLMINNINCTDINLTLN